MDDTKLIISMRLMAWERAKAELYSMLQTYWPQYTSKGEEIDKGFRQLKTEIDKFIEKVEAETPDF